VERQVSLSAIGREIMAQASHAAAR
jgi:hypothetical protein